METRATVDLALSVAEYFRYGVREAQQELDLIRAAVRGWLTWPATLV